MKDADQGELRTTTSFEASAGQKEVKTTLTFTQDQRETVTEAAQKLGMTFATYVRMAALERMIKDGK